MLNFRAAELNQYIIWKDLKKTGISVRTITWRLIEMFPEGICSKGCNRVSVEQWRTSEVIVLPPWWKS